MLLAPSTRARGFTLIELLIVVLILGVLAAILIATVRSASGDAKRTAAEDNTRLTQQAIELYKADTGQLPDLLGPDWTPLTDTTTVAGSTVGPYLQAPPRNPLATVDPSSVADGTGTVYTDVSAFLYDYNSGAGTGRFVASVDPSP